ncbi:MAG: SDR family NAD(P)-dependent oxidoreductase [bacterium]
MNLLLIFLDFLLILFSLIISTILRFDFAIPYDLLSSKLPFFVAYSLINVFTFVSFGEYEEKWEYSSLREYTKTILSFLSVNLFMGAFFYFSEGLYIPRTIFLISLPISIMFIISIRVFYRGLKEYQINKNVFPTAVIVCKENNLSRIFQELTSYNILAIFLDEKIPKGRLFKGIPIYYDLSFLRNIPVNEVYVDKDVGEEVYYKVVDFKPLGAIIRKIEFTPGVFIHNFRVEDIIKRERRLINLEIDPDKIYLITGAGGSIGKYICKELINKGAKHIKFVDISEENLHNLYLELLPFESCKKEYILFDIQEPYLDKIVGNVDIIFHCAAKKHVPIVEENKYIAYKTNVIGLLNTLEALKSKHRTFIFISTDKAVNPINFMGLTKRIGEILTLSYKQDYLKAIVVRFGNVFGTSGSLIPSLIKQINMYNKVLITDKNVKRYFMLPEEAAKLIISSMYIDSGKIAVLDMGEQINIYELAQKVIQLIAPSRKVDIHIVGLKKGEKLQEELFFDYEKIIEKKDNIFIVDPIINIPKSQIIDFVKSIERGMQNVEDIDSYIEQRIKDFLSHEITIR